MFEFELWAEAHYESPKERSFVIYRLKQDLFKKWVLEIVAGNNNKEAEPAKSHENYSSYRLAYRRFHQLCQYRVNKEDYKLLKHQGQTAPTNLQAVLFE